LRLAIETNGFNDLQNGETEVVSSGRPAISVPTIITEISVISVKTEIKTTIFVENKGFRRFAA
jgi:hypothetical protein